MPGHREERTIKKMIAENNRMINTLNNKFKTLKGRAPGRTTTYKHKVKKSSDCGCS